MEPAGHLRPFIYCYWQLRTLRPLAETFAYRVVADGCIDIFFEPDNPACSYVMGFSSGYTSFPLPPQFNYAGVRFLPLAFPSFFGINAAEITNRFEELSQLLPQTAQYLASHFHPMQGAAEIQHLLDQYFSGVLSRLVHQPDGRLMEALELILQRHGMLNLENELNIGISPRQLRRLFSVYVGDSPKVFSKIVRFQHLLRTNPSVEQLKKHKDFFDCGYYDQAHFIKEFKTLFGTTPVKALGNNKLI